ncbi:aldehyde dehydrogenase family protein [Nakamurella flava]|uniref:Aldehyde dehydrogenase family protein n=1 Tax=Nakamurella flava TaxID=2576308 RepID=A0A4V6CTZ8_9ACTN|nr:aldehyde dehydrogenase family protein [Nakamurella flava]TKV61165.1 aldehyde dehydrogenase family protein [Nakamurella flava]
MTTTAAAPADTTTYDTDLVLAAADAAAPVLAAQEGAERARWMRTVAAAVDEHRAELLDLAVAETCLPRAALDVEVTRTVFQLQHLADRAASPELLDLVVEEADADYPVAPRPALVRAALPIGPVLVFTASNFPFAFSVVGNDTASAWAAGCPVVVKGNPGHPQLSRRTFEVAVAALRKAGAPDGTLGHLTGVAAGTAALVDGRIRACGFTGSLAGGRVLFDLAVGRPDPIPFFGELASLNPVYVTPAAAQARVAEIAAGFAASVTGRGGQLCTKPGVLFAPAGSGLAAAAAAAMSPDDVDLLTDRIAHAYQEGVKALAALPGATVHAGGAATQAALVTIPAAEILFGAVTLEECFGPAAVVVEYDDPADLTALADRIDGALTATVHGEPADPVAAALVPALTERVGRVIWNGWPTGVAVTRALHHGGPYPASTAPSSTSIGADAARRWQRPVTFQNWPAALLPGPVRTALTRSAGRRG